MTIKPLFFLVLIVALLVSPGASLAQQEAITLAVPSWLEDAFSPEAFEAFEVEFGATVEVVTNDDVFFPPVSVEGLDMHLDAVESYVAAADVVFVSSDSLSVEATRAGYFLDLAPLAASDPTLSAEDFYPAAWALFQWDQGLWGLPAVVDIISLQYIPTLFDQAGVAYPTESWTLDDVVRTARAVVQYDTSGEQTSPGLLTLSSLSRAFLFYALSGTQWHDGSTPRFTDPALERVLDMWVQLKAENVIYMPRMITPGMMPLAVENTGWLHTYPPEMPQAFGLPLPGGVVGMSGQGFAVSGGTLQPELAYALTKHITQTPQIVYSLYGFHPARQSLVGMDVEGSIMSMGQFPEENEAFLENALMRAVPASAVRHADYLELAMRQMEEDGVSAAVALQTVEAEAIANLQAAADRRGSVAVQVAPPPAPPEVAPGEIVLDFGTVSIMAPIMNTADWQPVMDAFVAADPEVGAVVLDDHKGELLADVAAESDCFLLPYNSISSLPLEHILNFDPFLDADPTFDRADVMVNALAQVQRNNKIWAMPISLQPEILRYHADQFAAAGLPAGSWTTEQFTEALMALKPTADAPAPFVPQPFNENYILMLVAAYGGLPLDYRTAPPTIQFTEPTTVEAIRQVLDLARAGYIDYEKVNRLGSSGGGGGGGGPADERTESIYPDTLNVFTQHYTENSPYRATAYPHGSLYTPVMYRLTTAYISASAESPEACYRWISEMAQHPELFEGMPARRSQLGNPALAAQHGEALVQTYRDLDAQMQAPTTVVIPPQNGMNQYTHYPQQWLYRAFDRYVLEGADLDAELADAQIIAEAYHGCVADLGVVPTDTDYASGLYECAQTADPAF